MRVPHPRHVDSSVIVADRCEAHKARKLKGQIYVVTGHDLKTGLIERKIFKRGQTIIQKYYGKYYWTHPQLVKPIHVRPFGKHRYEIVS